MKRVMIIGSCGAGKSIFATQLSTITGLDLVHLDQHYWQPDWIEPTKIWWLQKMNDLVSHDTWIIDGNYSGTIDVRINRSDTIIFLDFNRSLCLYRIVKRYLQYAGKPRPDMAPGCPEKLDPLFLAYVWNFKNVQRKKIYQKIDAVLNEKKVIILKNRTEVERFLNDSKVKQLLQ